MIFANWPWQAGQTLVDGSGTVREVLAPHVGQNADPWNISAKHVGQLIVARRAWQ